MKIYATKGMAYLKQGRLKESFESFKKSYNYASESSYTVIRATILCNLADVLFWQGKLKKSYEESESAINLSRIKEIIAPSGGLAMIQKARVLYEWNRLDEARQMIQSGLKITSASGVTDSFGLGHLLYARILTAKGETGEAEKILKQAGHIVRQFNIERMKNQYDAYRAGFDLKIGNFENARVWADIYSNTEKGEHITDVEDLTLGRVRMMEKEYTDAIQIVSNFAEEASKRKRLKELKLWELFHRIQKNHTQNHT